MTAEPKPDVEGLARLLAEAGKYLAPGDWTHGAYSIGWISAPSLKGGDTHVADVRGWGYLTGGGHGALGLTEDEALDQQRAWGDLIVAAVNALPQLLSQSQAQGEEIGPPTPLGALKFRMEQGGHTQADLAKLLGSRARASEILAGKRDLSKAQIAILVDTWGIPARSLLGPDATNWKARAETAEAQVTELRAEVERLKHAADEGAAGRNHHRGKAAQARLTRNRALDGMEHWKARADALQSKLDAARIALSRRAYVLTVPHLSGYRLIMGFNTREDLHAAHDALISTGGQDG